MVNAQHLAAVHVRGPRLQRVLHQAACAFPEHQLLALDDAGSVIGRINSAPFAWSGRDEDLPERGWGSILEQAFADNDRGKPVTAVSLLEARVVPTQQGQGLSSQLLEAARRKVQRLGLTDLFGPVRPTGKSQEPQTPMVDYLARLRSDGLPVDVAGALTPLHVSVEHDHAVYIEPNVWLHHRLLGT